VAMVTSPKVNRQTWLARYRRVRAASEAMCAHLEPAEYRLQPCDDVSPPWWNLGHTSWFFARNVLRPFGGGWNAIDEEYDYLLNSYYASLGARLPRNKRGAVTRPTTDEVYAYRASVDARIVALVELCCDSTCAAILDVLRIGLEHEQQHQELFYAEIKSILAQNPPALRRAYAPRCRQPVSLPLADWQYRDYEGGLFEFGHAGDEWCWDNELPRHPHYLTPFALADRLVTCGAYREFMEDGGYENQLLWLDNGWQHRQAEGWSAPLYWERHDGEWRVWALTGEQSLIDSEPVCHVSFYEADAFARWRAATFDDDAGARLSREFEWEHAARLGACAGDDGAFVEAGLLHPTTTTGGSMLQQMCGQLWQWTSSYYEGYPGYQPFPGALAEYNGKFMDNQRVLRGGSCVTPRDHFRLTYRNFWSAATRFQFTGIRLARDLRD
jgi:ergothioneine biosynthesis protein EgtB